MEQKITQGLQEQPAIELLYKIDTFEQLAAEWVCQRLFYNCVSEHWKAIYGATKDPLRKALDSGIVTEKDSERACLTAIYLWRLWELIQVSFYEHLQPELVKQGLADFYPNAFELFGAVVVYESRSSFSKCLEPLFTFDARKRSRVFRQAVKALAEGKPLPEEDANPFVCWIINICQPKATNRNKVLRSAFTAFKADAIELFDFSAKDCWHAPNYRWNNGHYERGRPGGTYQPLKKLHKNTQFQLNERILL